jgi:hypothetical protein
MTKRLVFLVDDVLADGSIVTPTHRLRQLSPNFQPNIFDRTIDLYRKYCVDKIQFMPLREFNIPEPGVKYAYFVPVNDWHWTFQQVFFMLDRSIQNKFAEYDIPIYFSQDIEMYPNVQFSFLGNYLGILDLFKHAHSNTNVKLVIGMCALLEKNQAMAIENHFGDRLRLIATPLQVPWTRDMVIEKYAQNGAEFDPRNIFNQYMTSEKLKSYMCLNRDPKFSRIMMLHALRAYGLLEDGYVSNQFPTHMRVNFENTSSLFLNMIQRDIEVGMIPRMQVDELPAEVVCSVPNEGGTTNIIPIDQMIASCYDLVQETTTRYDVPEVVDQGVITDKIVRSLMFGKPFLVNGGPRVLEIVKGFGFNTCSYLFDESYDSESDFFMRLQKIVANVQKWQGRHEEFMRRVEQNRESLQYNIDRVMNFPLEDELIRVLCNEA